MLSEQLFHCLCTQCWLYEMLFRWIRFSVCHSESLWIKVWAKYRKCHFNVMLMTFMLSFEESFTSLTWSQIFMQPRTHTHTRTNTYSGTQHTHSKPLQYFKRPIWYNKEEDDRENVIGGTRLGPKKFLICFLSSTALHFVRWTKLSIKLANLFYVVNRTEKRVFILSIEG